jgi:hypothetical protein
MDATRISDGKPVMLKKLLSQEGPYELEINKLFSTEPLSSNPRNRCVHLLDVIEFPNDSPIIVHPMLRPFYKPPFQTYGEFVTFFAQICEVSPLSPLITPTFVELVELPIVGRPIHARKSRRSQVCHHRSPHSRF